jgi:hypothetical protein
MATTKKTGATPKLATSIAWTILLAPDITGKGGLEFKDIDPKDPTRGKQVVIQASADHLLVPITESEAVSSGTNYFTSFCEVPKSAKVKRPFRK